MRVQTASLQPAGICMTQPLDYQSGAARANQRWRALHLSPHVLAALAILSSWLSIGFGPLLFPLMIVFFVLLAVRRYWRALAVSVALSPMFMGVVIAAVGYCRGDGKLQG